MSSAVFWTLVFGAFALASLIREATRRDPDETADVLRTREELRRQTLAHALRQDVQP